MNPVRADFWPLVDQLRWKRCIMAYALAWTAFALPIALSIRIGAHPAQDLYARHWWQLSSTPVVIAEYAVAMLLAGAVLSLPHLFWLSAVERRGASGRLHFALRSVAIGAALGLIEGGLLAPLFFAISGRHLAGLAFSMSLFCAALIAGYVVGRINAKALPFEPVQIL